MKLSEQDKAFWVFFVVLTVLSLYLVVNTADQIALTYTYIIFACFSLFFFNLSVLKVKGMVFIGKVRKQGALIPIILGFGLGFMLAGGALTGSGQWFSFLSPLAIPQALAVSLGQTSLVFLLGIMVAVVEETFFRGLLFPFFNNVIKKETLSIAFWIGGGILLIFISDLQIAGWGMIAFGIYDRWQKGTLIRNERVRLGLTASVVSLIFANFHMMAYSGDFSMLLSAFIFSMVACYLYVLTKSLIAPIIAHTFNNTVILSVTVLHLPNMYPIIMTGVLALMFFVLSTKTFNLSRALSLKGIGIR